MHWDVVEVKPETNYRLFVRFKDGLSGHVQLRRETLTGVLAPLLDAQFFGQVFIDEGAVAWPGEIDLAPDAMYAEVASRQNEPQHAVGSLPATKYILDTVIFNRLVEGRLSVEDLPSDGTFVATHIQKDELSRTGKTEKREQLLSKFSEFIPTLEPTASLVFDVSRWDQARWSDGKLFQELKTALDTLKKKPNNVQDALIAEVAIVDRCTLVTCDKNLAQVARAHGAEVREFA